MERELQAGGDQFLAQVFLPGEIAYCASKRYPARHYAARFAAKEAVLKAMVPERTHGGALREIEVTGGGGAPGIILHGALRARAETLRVRRILLSLSHTTALAMAGVVIES